MQTPVSFLTAMEEYVKDAPRTSTARKDQVLKPPQPFFFFGDKTMAIYFPRVPLKMLNANHRVRFYIIQSPATERPYNSYINFTQMFYIAILTFKCNLPLLMTLCHSSTVLSTCNMGSSTIEISGSVVGYSSNLLGSLLNVQVMWPVSVPSSTAPVHQCSSSSIWYM